MNKHVQLAPSRPSQAGFTLIELMIAIVILGILTAIAIPQYRNYVISGKIPLATAGLGSEVTAMEQFFQDRQTYVGAPGCSSAGTNNTTAAQYFTFTCTGAGATANSYTLQAAGIGTMNGISYTVDQTGAKTTIIGAGAPSGWVAHSPNNCWIVGTGGKC